MTAKAALIRHLLSGQVINIKTCFSLIGLTNAPREISRMIERPFGVMISRTQREGTSRYGQPVIWFDYRLNHTEYNAEGIKKMTEYLIKHDDTVIMPSGDKTETNYIGNATTSNVDASKLADIPFSYTIHDNQLPLFK